MKTIMDVCTYCGRPDADVFETISKHRTAEGATTWTRCVCGSLQARIADGAGSRVVSRGRPAVVHELAVSA